MDTPTSPGDDGSVGRMPASGARVVLIAAMIVIAPGAGLLLLISWIGLIGGYENTESSDTWLGLLGLGAAVGLLATVLAIYGLANRSRVATAVAALAQGSATVFLLVLWTSATDGDSAVIAGFLVVIVIDVMMILAASPVRAAQPAGVTTAMVNPALQREAITAVKPLRERPMADSIQRRVSLIGMVAIAAIGGLGVLFEQAMGGPFNLRLAGGAALLALPAVVAIRALGARSRQVVTGAAIVQGATATLLLFLWEHPRWPDLPSPP